MEDTKLYRLAAWRKYQEIWSTGGLVSKETLHQRAETAESVARNSWQMRILSDEQIRLKCLPQSIAWLTNFFDVSFSNFTKYFEENHKRYPFLIEKYYHSQTATEGPGREIAKHFHVAYLQRKLTQEEFTLIEQVIPYIKALDEQDNLRWRNRFVSGKSSPAPNFDSKKEAGP